MRERRTSASVHPSQLASDRQSVPPTTHTTHTPLSLTYQHLSTHSIHPSILFYNCTSSSGATAENAKAFLSLSLSRLSAFPHQQPTNPRGANQLHAPLTSDPPSFSLSPCVVSIGFPFSLSHSLTHSLRMTRWPPPISFAAFCSLSLSSSSSRYRPPPPHVLVVWMDALRGGVIHLLQHRPSLLLGMIAFGGEINPPISNRGKPKLKGQLNLSFFFILSQISTLFLLLTSMKLNRGYRIDSSALIYMCANCKAI